MLWKKGTFWVCCFLVQSLLAFTSEASNREVLKPRVPQDQMTEARSWSNPFPSTPENIEEGKIFFTEKHFV